MFSKGKSTFYKANSTAAFGLSDQTLYSVIVVAILLFSNLSFGGKIVFSEDELPSSKKYLNPNETHPQDLLPIFEHLQSGLYISVGTERGFMAAGLTDKITSLLLLDYNSNIITFNEINIALLKAAKNREDYLRLRFHSDARDWLKIFLGEYGEERALKIFVWWSTNVRHNAKFGEFEVDRSFDHSYDESRNRQREYAFDSANYLYLDENFNRLKKLADADQITTLHMSLDSRQMPTEVRALINSQPFVNKKIAAIDISNAYDNNHMGQENTRKFLNLSLSLVEDDTLLITTTRRESYIAYSYKFVREKTENSVDADNFINTYLSESPEAKARFKNGRSFLNGQSISGPARPTLLQKYMRCILPLKTR